MTGAERAQPHDGLDHLAAPEGPANDWIGSAETPLEAEAADEGPAPRSAAVRAFGALLLLLALAWIAAAGWTFWQGRASLTLPAAVSAIATSSAPLVLLALLWMWLGRTPRREAERFTRAVAEMRSESTALESVLGIVATRIEENHARLRGEAERLMSLGDEASDRLGRVTYYLAKETATLDRKAAALDSAASSAKIDIGVLLHDLPRAEEQARAVAEAMKEAGLQAHGQAGALEAQLAALAARGREADEVLGGAAQRMAAHVSRIESSSSAAAAGMVEAAAGMNGAVDSAMARASEAVEAARAGLEAQASATLAAIDHNRASLEAAGEEAARNLARRLDWIGARMDELAGRLAAQDASSQALVTGLGKELAELDSWFEQLGQTGSAQTERLAGSVTAVRESIAALIEELGGGRAEAGALIESGREMSLLFDGVADQLDVKLPHSLATARAGAEQTQGALTALLPVAETLGRNASSLEGTIAGLGERVALIASSVAAQDERSRAMVAALVEEADTLQERFSAATATGQVQSEQLSASLTQLRATAAELDSELAAGGAHTGELSARAAELGAALERVSAQLGSDLPEALERIEAQTRSSHDRAAALAPVLAGVEASAGAVAVGLSASEAGIARQREALDALLLRIEEGSLSAEDKLASLGRAASEAQESAARIVADTAPELVEALVRVRETAKQAAERAREAIAAVIPSSAAALGEAGREALSRAVAETVERQMAELAAVSERALRTARSASERLTRQMLTIGETAAAIEDRIEEARKEREDKDSENFSRRVALLIESLNSTAIDVTKILSNEVTDSAWAAYLKGDRGVFTRRAVRLIDTAEAREIARHYEEEPEFREQVNRYIHDFEAMLRRILADRDGSPLGVTILSSDMGKLYVALAQAIERLRK